MPSDWEQPVSVPGREVHRYAIHVDPQDLTYGAVYYRLSYVDERMLVPELAPLVFVGRDLDGPESDGRTRFYFQDAGSYFAGVRRDDSPVPLDGASEEERLEQILERGHFEVFVEGQVSVLTFENALNLLLLRSVTREKPLPD